MNLTSVEIVFTRKTKFRRVVNLLFTIYIGTGLPNEGNGRFPGHFQRIFSLLSMQGRLGVSSFQNPKLYKLYQGSAGAVGPLYFSRSNQGPVSSSYSVDHDDDEDEDV